MAEIGRWACIIFCALALWYPLAGAASSQLAGRPPVARLPVTLEVYPQNFDIAQDAQSVLYVANSDGVLIFDGDRWSLLRLPNADLARTLAFDGVDRVYVGGFGTFGYIQRDETGAEVYHDLSARFATLLRGEKFEDIWDIHLSPRGVFFRALNHVFLYQPDDGLLRLWRHAGRFGAITEYRGQTLLQFRGEGLKLLQGEGWQLLPGSEPLGELVYQLIAMPGDALLTVSSDGRWRRYDDGRVREQKMPPGMPASSQFSHVRRLLDGTLALAGVDGRLYLLDPAATTLRSFHIGSTLSGLSVARDGGLLTAGEDVIYHVAWPAPWTVAGAAEGLSGSLFGAKPWRGRWYATTGHGVYEAGADGRFKHLDWTPHEAWDLLATGPDSALLAESYDLKLVRGRTAQRLVADLYPRLLVASKFTAGIVYVGTENGLVVMREQGGQWQLKLAADRVAPVRVNSIVEVAPRELWIGTERDGVRWLRLDENYSGIAETRSYGSGHGIGFGSLNGGEVVQARSGRLLVTTSAGVYVWKDGRFEADPMEGLVDLRREDEWLTLDFSAPDGSDWAFSDTHIFHRPSGGHWRREELGGILQGAVQGLAFEADGSAVFTASSVILRHAAAMKVPAGKTPPLLLRSAERVGTRGKRTPLPLRPSSLLRFAEDERLGFVFRFALPELRRPDATRYQARLVGAGDGFSEWTEATTFTYTRLGPGEYRFEARARDPSGQVSELAPYGFVIEPRWYGSWWGRSLLALVFLALLAMLVVAITGWRTRRLSLDRDRLEAMVAQRTRELESANRQLQAIAHLDGLTEIPNRRRLDDYLSEVWQHCAAQKRPMSVLVIDGDHFKVFNDAQGHLAGDELLKRIAELLSSCLRRSEDLVARYGGDEFVVVMPGASMEMALDVAAAMCSRVAEAQLGVTVSIGVASHHPLPDEPVSTLVHEADEALYEAKRRGRNRVSAYDGTWS